VPHRRGGLRQAGAVSASSPIAGQESINAASPAIQPGSIHPGSCSSTSNGSGLPASAGRAAAPASSRTVKGERASSRTHPAPRSAADSASRANVERSPQKQGRVIMANKVNHDHTVAVTSPDTRLTTNATWRPCGPIHAPPADAGWVGSGRALAVPVGAQSFQGVRAGVAGQTVTEWVEGVPAPIPPFRPRRRTHPPLPAVALQSRRPSVPASAGPGSTGIGLGPGRVRMRVSGTAHLLAG
jgi:hypothetical protein